MFKVGGPCITQPDMQEPAEIWVYFLLWKTVPHLPPIWKNQMVIGFLLPHPGLEHMWLIASLPSTASWPPVGVILLAKFAPLNPGYPSIKKKKNI